MFADFPFYYKRIESRAEPDDLSEYDPTNLKNGKQLLIKPAKLIVVRKIILQFAYRMVQYTVQVPQWTVRVFANTVIVSVGSKDASNRNVFCQ